MISNITISNIKGFGTTDNSLDLELNPKRINIVVAPNGFGKSSLATAIKCINNNNRRLDVELNNKYKKEDALNSFVSIVVDGVKYESDKNKNEITRVLNCIVINSRTIAAVSTKRFGTYTRSQGYVDIEDIEVAKVPNKPTFKYKVSVLQRAFGKNGNKVIKDISHLFSNNTFMSVLPQIFPVYKKFEAKMRSSLTEEVIKKISSMNGDIAKQVDDSLFINLEKEPSYKDFLSILENYMTVDDKLNDFQVFFQLNKIYQNHKKDLSDLANWAKYQNYKKNIADSIRRFNTSNWAHAEMHETKGKLVIKFPKADELSNGQRDILTFITQLIIANSQLSNTKKNFVIIDEVFDYMDDATQIAAQYYLSKMLDIEKGNIYLVMLTHLDPNNFRSYIFNKKKINIQYLSKSNISISDSMRAFITFRDDKNTNKDLKDKLSRYFFHYHPCSNIDLTNECIPNVNNLKKAWFRLGTFKSYIIGELNKYLKEEEDYDPYAVCFALRYGIEKQVYFSLSKEDEKQKFIETFGTENKLNYAENHNARHSDSFHILAAIYNDAEHSTDYTKDKRCIFKLQNKVIRDIIKTIFDYHGTDINIDVIE